MKNKFFLFVLFLLATQLLVGQNIITVDNSPGSIANYTDLQDAIDDAGPDELIYVAGTGIDYGGIIINKKVNIIGPGYFLAANQGGIVNPTPAIVSDIRITAGANNCYISGLYTDPNNPVYDNVSITGAANIILENCNIAGDIIMENSSGINIRNNYCSPNNQVNELKIDKGCSNINFKNNILGFRYFKVNEESAAVFSNNIIFGFLNPSSSDINNSIFKSNIFMVNFMFTSTSCTILNNLFTLPQNEIPPGNIGADDDEIFVGYPDLGNYSLDSRYELAPNSPAIGAGEGGTDCGIFGGSDPYVLSGVPAIPLIYSVDAPSSVPAGGTIQVTVKARSN